MRKKKKKNINPIFLVLHARKTTLQPITNNERTRARKISHEYSLFFRSALRDKFSIAEPQEVEIHLYTLGNWRKCVAREKLEENTRAVILRNVFCNSSGNYLIFVVRSRHEDRTKSKNHNEGYSKTCVGHFNIKHVILPLLLWKAIKRRVTSYTC